MIFNVNADAGENPAHESQIARYLGELDKLERKREQGQRQGARNLPTNQHFQELSWVGKPSRAESKRAGNRATPKDALQTTWSRPTTPAQLGLRPVTPMGYSLRVAPMSHVNDARPSTSGDSRGCMNLDNTWFTTSMQWERAERIIERDRAERIEQHRRSYDKRAGQRYVAN